MTATQLVTTGVSKNDSVLRRTAVIGVVLAGAALLMSSSYIHASLWSQSYRFIPTIGPLFLAQSIVGAGLALAVVFYRRVVTVVAGAAYMAASVGGLLLSTEVSLFGYQDGLMAPLARASLNIEAAGIVVFVAALFLLLAPRLSNGRTPLQATRR